jgi:hypothetical protein
MKPYPFKQTIPLDAPEPPRLNQLIARWYCKELRHVRADIYFVAHSVLGCQVNGWDEARDAYNALGPVAAEAVDIEKNLDSAIDAAEFAVIPRRDHYR